MPKHRKEGAAAELDCSGLETLLEPYLDGDLAGDRRSALEAHLETCAWCAEELALARRIRSELREMPRLACPPAVTRAAFAHAGANPPVTERLRRLWTGRRLWAGRLWQPVFATLVAVALGVGYWRLAAPAPPDDPAAAYTAEEIAQAETELKLALAYVGDIGQKARQKFSAEVGDRVVAPFTRSIAGAFLPDGEAAASDDDGGSPPP